MRREVDMDDLLGQRVDDRDEVLPQIERISMCRTIEGPIPSYTYHRMTI